MMTENQNELISIIKSSDNPDLALQIATEIILNYLKQPLSSQEQDSVGLREQD